jgi:hypothetical protein
MGVMNWKRPTAMKGTMNRAKTSFSTEIFAGAIISVVQYLATVHVLECPLRLQYGLAMAHHNSSVSPFLRGPTMYTVQPLLLFVSRGS